LSRLLTIAAVVFASALLAPASSAAAGRSCDERVLVDWSDNGRIDGVYPLRCYEGAIASMPTDIRDYTNAESIIARALSSAVRESPAQAEGAGAAPASTAPTGVPVVLLVLFGFALTLLAAGGVGYLSRRGAVGRPDPRG
jgi:hypothetical protein